VSWLAPLSLAQLAGLLAVAFGLLAWLHLRAPRPQRTRVAYLAAWDEVAPARATRRARWALANSWALLRALAIATLIGVALSDPKPSWFSSPARTTLLVLDAGSHMLATDEKPSRFERARELAATMLAQGSARDRILVAQLDSALVPLSSWSLADAHGVQLRAALSAARPTTEATSFSALTAFALEQLSGQSGARVVLISDGAFETAASELARLRDAGIELRHRKVGSSSANLAVRAFAVRAHPWGGERCQALVELENTGAQPRAVELTIFEGQRPIDVRPFRLGARSRVREFLEFGATGPQFGARISAKDGTADDQPRDDEAYASLTQLPPLRVLLVTDGQRYLESALALDRRLFVDKQPPAAFRSARGYDLAIFDRFVPSQAQAVPTVWIAPNWPGDSKTAVGPGAKNASRAAAVARGGEPYRVLGMIERPFFDEVRADSPVLRTVSLRDVNIRRAQRAELEPKDEVLARSKLGPLIVKGERAGAPFIALTFDVRESDLVLRTAWPILISQIVRQLTAARSAAAGTTQLTAATPASATPATIAPKRIAPEPRTEQPFRGAWQSRGAAWCLLFGAVLVLAIDAWRRSRGSQ
jgi:hypothetical protein